MTHSLHRRGSPESLKEDYVLLVTAAADVNHEGAKEKLRRILEEVFEVGPANIGSYDTGTVLTGVTHEEIKAKLALVPRVRCSFSSREKIKEIISRIRDLDLGMSVTVEGPTEEILAISKELGIKPHSVNHSLDIWGKRTEIPSEEILEFVTMCGHGLISQHLVKKLIAEVQAGKKTPKEAAMLTGQPCVCGIYNPDRATKLFEKYLPVDCQTTTNNEQM